MSEKDITPIEEIWDEVLGHVGTVERDKADAEAEEFCLSERLKGNRKKANMNKLR